MLALLSVLVLATAVVLWVRSYQHFDAWEWGDDQNGFRAVTERGDLFIKLQRRNDVWAAPFWTIVVLALIVPIIQAIPHVRRRARRIAGHCVVCNYDLRATPDRCPECGTAPTKLK
jgi:hypothetical protein